MSRHDDPEEPDHENPFSVGTEVTVTGLLCTNNNVGGTEIIQENGAVQCEVTKAFWDYETGWRYHGKVLDPQFVERIRVKATTPHTPEDYEKQYPNNPQLAADAREAQKKFDPSKVYFSEQDIEPAPKPGRRM